MPKMPFLPLCKKFRTFAPMSKFSVNILGCGSATPSMRHLPSAQVVDFRDTLYMVDCGECAQLQMRRMRLRFSHLRHIFISHLHGDHFLGLPGLLSTLSLHECTGEVHVYMFAEGIELMRRMMKMLVHEPTVRIIYHEVDPAGGVVLDTDALTVEAFPLYHRVRCVGYIFREKPRPRPLRADMLEFFGVPVRERAAIKAGADFVTPDGRVIENARLTTDPGPSLSYAYCSDTVFDPRVAAAIAGVSTIYHEATYTDEFEALAAPRGHSTARQAGKTAAAAGARKLILGHFSKKYQDENTHLAQAREEFPNTIVAAEGMKIDIE